MKERKREDLLESQADTSVDMSDVNIEGRLSKSTKSPCLFYELYTSILTLRRNS